MDHAAINFYNIRFQFPDTIKIGMAGTKIINRNGDSFASEFF